MDIPSIRRHLASLFHSRTRDRRRVGGCRVHVLRLLQCRGGCAAHAGRLFAFGPLARSVAHRARPRHRVAGRPWIGAARSERCRTLRRDVFRLPSRAGVERSEISQGLYPQAPELAKAQDLTPAQQFWIIKQGVKLSAMPAWGRIHPGPLIWDMVAFVRKLPGMSPEQYKATIASAPAVHDAMMKDMPGTK